MYAPPTVSPLSMVKPKLTPKDRQGVGIAKAWKEESSAPTYGAEGAVVYEFGATLPFIVCAPLYICDVQLQAGEIINNIDIGDAVRWKISPASSGEAGSQVTHVLIKPTDAGLKTNLVITTTKRTYVLNLTSSPTDWMPRVSFSYPEEQKAAWSEYVANQKAAIAVEAARQTDIRRATVLPTGQPLAQLDFGFSLSGDTPEWRPLRVYADGSKTYIQFPTKMKFGEAPALIGVGDGNTAEIINYRMEGDRYVVDQVINRAALISGVGGRQVKVEIKRDGRG
jgi:type IV secretion system protein VirB9